MRLIDIGRVALKYLRGKWMLAPLACLVAGTVCLCHAGAIGVSLGSEKRKPCELTVTAPYNKSLQTTADIMRIPDVMAVTPVLPVQVTLKSGQYTASITLQGIDGRYLQEEYATGGVFPGDSAMPYIVLNKAGEKSFIDPNGPPSPADADYSPNIDWLNAPIGVFVGGDTDAPPVTSKICGILADDKQAKEAAGYIDINLAKKLLRSNQMQADVSSALVRIKNIGAAENTLRQIGALGYAVGDADPGLQAKWDSQQKEMIYLLWIGGICLVCASLLTASGLGRNIATGQNELDMLLWMGIRQTVIKKIFYWQATGIGIISAILGILISYLIPAFIPLEQKAISNFALPILPYVAFPAGLLCIGITALPGIFAVKKFNKYN